MSATVHYLPCTRRIVRGGKRPSRTQLAWLRRGLRNASGQLPLLSGGVWVRPATAEACVANGWVEECGRWALPQITDCELVRYRLTPGGRMAAKTRWSGE